MTATHATTGASHTVITDALLVQASLPEDRAAAFLDAVRQLPTGLAQGPVHAAWSESAGRLYAYVYLAEPAPVEAATARALEATLQARLPHVQGIQVSRLERAFQTTGASASIKPVFHYVVEMDPETGWMPELSQWYDTEHMPGLASVPGSVRASRFLNHDHGPLSLACYDLVTQEALGSPPWLAVRATDWSSRMRPHFTNTLRTMFKVLY